MSAPEIVPTGIWNLYQTARDLEHRLSPLPMEPWPEQPGEKTIVRVDATQRFQEIIGFGGALTESSAWVLAQLTSEKRREVIYRYYHPREGIGYTLARTHLNSCDFSLNLWSLAEVPGDYDLHHFTLDPMRRWVMSLLHDAQAAAGGGENFKLMVSPWSPPAWMKTNNRMDDGGSLRREYAPAWADFYVRFAQAMERDEQLPVWAFTVQNEPEAHQTWESCLYTPEQERDFVKNHLGPALAKAGLADKIKLLGWDHNRDKIEARAATLLNDPEAAKHFWGLALHWYVSSDFAASARVHSLYPDKPILFTEGCWEGGGNLGTWEHGEGYAAQMIGDFRNWVCGYIDWNIALDQRGGPNHVGNFCDAPVLVNTRTGEVTYTPAFFYIAHFSRFVRPSAKRLGVTVDSPGLETVAFANPDATAVIVVLNRTAAAINFELVGVGEARQCRIPARAIQTYQQGSAGGG
ncbi:MAG: glycoside hydrolase family 30 protein [Candidatus Didemnitutus sp.]|nr:glycoside hydrolase family 30 protein [Candidatus Didemnitutus sp.]